MLWKTATFRDDNKKDRSFRRDTRHGWIRRYQVRDVHGTPRRGEVHESCRRGWLCKDKKGAHQ